VCVFVSLCVCVQVWKFPHSQIDAYTRLQVRTHAHECTRACTYARTHACMHARTHVRTHASTHARGHAVHRTSERMHARAHARPQAQKVMVIKQMPTNCVQANDGGPYILTHINCNLSMKQSTHPHSFFLSLRICEEISYSQKFRPERPGVVSKKSRGCAPPHHPGGRKMSGFSGTG